MLNWVTSPSHHRWLADHASGLLTFGRRTARPDGGASWLDEHGQPIPSEGLHTWIVARMTHVYGVGSLLGIPGCRPIATAAMAGLTGALRDREHGGWFSSIGSDGPAAGKSCYEHAFVLLAASTAVQAEIDGGSELLVEASATFLDRFWDEEIGRCVDVWDTSFEVLDPYRGLNANMHAVEAMLSVAGATGDLAWLGRAERISRFVMGMAEANRWRIPEHYDAEWRPDLEYNRDDPANQFKPFGATVGHAFEWSRLLLHLANAPIEEMERDSIVNASVHLFDNAVQDGWARNGRDGFLYTTDWDGTPVVDDRLHWVLAEAIVAAAVLHRQTGDPKYAEWYRRWWDHAATHHIDGDGSWKHQLDAENRPASTVWKGKPDLYHAFQAAVIPTLPLFPMIAASIGNRR